MRRSITLAVLVAGVAGVAASSPSFAATVTSTGGEVSVNQGTGFRRVAGTVVAGVGASVMVGPTGSGQIVYEDGCRVDLNPNTVMNIAERSPCVVAATQTNYTIPIIGAVVLGGGVAAILLSRKDEAKPASP